MWEQGGTQLEPAVQVAPSLADLGDHLWEGDCSAAFL